jgi:hypothetical protein
MVEVCSLSHTIVQTEGTVDAAGSVEDTNMTARKEMNKKVRANKLLLR